MTKKERKVRLDTLENDVTQEEMFGLSGGKCLGNFLWDLSRRFRQVSDELPVSRREQENEHNVDEQEKEVSLGVRQVTDRKPTTGGFGKRLTSSLRSTRPSCAL